MVSIRKGEYQAFACAHCNLLIEGSAKNKKFCSPKCRYAARDARPEVKARQNAQKRESYVPTGASSGPPRTQPDTCIVEDCDREPLALSKCQKHYRAQRRAEGVPWANEGSGRFKARARRFGVSYEPINRFDVFERDAWICGICGDPVSRSDASIDHVIPLSKGGPHSFENVQCAHVLCNSKKGARVD